VKTQGKRHLLACRQQLRGITGVGQVRHQRHGAMPFPETAAVNGR
jgi:hypothetical protein